MTSKDSTEAFVWMWLPGETEPVVAGRLDQDGGRLLYTYGASYRRRRSAISLYDPELARYASYEDLAEIIRHRFTDPKDTLKELYGRICFNVLCGNTDDHARNHAAFWDGRMLTLTPAYDICPQNRTGNEATQAMLIKGEGRASSLATLLAAAPEII